MSVTTDAGREQRRSLPLLRALLEGAVVVVFVLLIWNNFTLRRQQTRAAAAAKTARGFAAGDQLGAIPAMSLDGRRNDLDLRNSRGIVAIVNPGCDSCRELMASTRAVPGVHVLAAASIQEARAVAPNMAPDTRVMQLPLSGELGSRLVVYPQLFIIDRGKVVRTCATIAECR